MSTAPISAQVIWTSGTTTVAAIDDPANLGLAAGVAAGTTVITGTLDGVSGSTTLTVGGTVPKSLVITPAATTSAVTNSIACTAKEQWSDR